MLKTRGPVATCSHEHAIIIITDHIAYGSLQKSLQEKLKSL